MEIEKKLLSIIVPIYNGALYIPKLFSSILQYNEDIISYIEILLIDDGSKDNSLEICQHLAANNPSLIVYSKENGGIASARNFGLEKARGKYVAFMDQDDSLSNGYRNYIRKLEETAADILITDEVYNKNNMIDRRGYVKCDEICDKGRVKMLVRTLLGCENNSVFREYNCCPPTIWNCMFRIETIRKNGINLFKYVDYEDDWLFLINTLLHSNKVVFCEEPYYLWTINDISHSHRHRYIPDLQLKMNKKFDFLFSCMEFAEVPKSTLISKRQQNKRVSLLNVFYNSTYSKYGNFKKEIKEAMEDYYSEDIFANINSSKGVLLQNLYLKMFKQGIYIVPYLMNRYVLKKRFH